MNAGTHENSAPAIGPVVVVGPCASGKTTLVTALRQLGYEARVCGQEHSEIATLWRRSQPSLVIGLSVDLATLRSRRGTSWSSDLYEHQCRRLRPAMDAAAIVLNTGELSPMAVLAAATGAIREAGIRPATPSQW